MYKHIELPSEGVPFEVRAVAELAAAVAAERLGLPRPTVRYMACMPAGAGETKGADTLLAEFGRAMGLLTVNEAPECWLDESPLLGLARKREPNTVWLLPFPDWPDLVRTACHEMHHRYSFAHWEEWKSLPPADWERAADAWAEECWLEVAVEMQQVWQRYQVKRAKRWRWVRGSRGLGQ